MPDGHCLNILLFWRRSTAASVFRVCTCFKVQLFSHSSPSLIGLLASVDVKQQRLTLTPPLINKAESCVATDSRSQSEGKASLPAAIAVSLEFT